MFFKGSSFTRTKGTPLRFVSLVRARGCLFARQNAVQNVAPQGIRPQAPGCCFVFVVAAYVSCCFGGFPTTDEYMEERVPRKASFPIHFQLGAGMLLFFLFSRLAGTVRARRTASTASTPNNPWLFGSGGARQAVVRGLREPRRQARLGAVAALGQGDGRSGQGAGREAVGSTPLAWDGQSHPLKWN